MTAHEQHRRWILDMRQQRRVSGFTPENHVSTEAPDIGYLVLGQGLRAHLQCLAAAPVARQSGQGIQGQAGIAVALE